jgi:hypothetical protein
VRRASIASSGARAGAVLVVVCGVLDLASPATADPARPAAPASIQIAALAPADDARRAVIIGTGGEVFEPDGKGAWVHKLQSSTAGPLVAAGRTGARGSGSGSGSGSGPGAGSIVALGDGVVYRLASNGWSAIRLVQHGKAILGVGARSLAAVGRQLFALDQLTRGEPTRLAVAPASIVAIAAGATAIVIATEAGLFRLEPTGGKLVALKAAPPHPRIVSDRWAITDRGAVDLISTRLTGWPRGLAIGVAAAAPDEALVAIGAGRGGLELVTLRDGKLARDPLGVSGTAVGVAVDRAGRAVVALSDGRIALRAPAGWTTTEVTDEAPAAHPGAAAATSE